VCVRLLSGGLRRLEATANQVAAGDLKARTGITSSSELGVAAAAFDGMTNELAGQIAERTHHLAAAQESEARFRRLFEQVPIALLEGYAGYLQLDGYDGYNAVCHNPDITRVGCLAHARRKFDEAVKAQGKGNKARAGKAHQGLAFIQQLYRIEHDIKHLSAHERHQHRQEKARPLWEKLRIWLEASLPQVPPKSATGMALNYLHEQWRSLMRYLDDPVLPLDNNACERAIRPFVIGRRGWLFSATVRGAKASANLYSLVETAKANGHEPYRYLRHVFAELPKAETLEQVAALLPYNLDPEEI